MKRPSLPEKETLALCYAALEPSKALFRKYVEMMEQLRTTGNISEQDHAILRLSPVAQRELMDVTLGDETALTGIGLKEVLSRVKESLVEEQKALAAAERAGSNRCMRCQRNLGRHCNRRLIVLLRRRNYPNAKSQTPCHLGRPLDRKKSCVHSC